MGLTLEGKMAYLTKFQVQAGVTLQQSHYNEPHVWNPDAPAVKKMMRTPNTYGYFTATYTPAFQRTDTRFLNLTAAEFHS